GPHHYPGALNRQIIIHHFASALRIQWPDPTMKDWKIQLPDISNISYQAIGYATHRAAVLRCGTKQLSPGCNTGCRAIATQYDHVVRLQIINQCNLVLIWV